MVVKPSLLTCKLQPRDQNLVKLTCHKYMIIFLLTKCSMHQNFIVIDDNEQKLRYNDFVSTSQKVCLS